MKKYGTNDNKLCMYMYSRHSNKQASPTLGRTNTECYRNGTVYHVWEAPVVVVGERVQGGHARLPMTHNNSPDEYISVTMIELETGRKWSMGQDVETAHDKIRGLCKGDPERHRRSSVADGQVGMAR